MNKHESIAIHESGHTVIHHYFRHPIESVMVGSDSGHCKPVGEWEVELEHERTVLLWKREALFQQLMAVVAGKCSVDRLYGYKVEYDENWRASEDYRQAHKLAMQLGGDEIGAQLWLKLAEHETDKLIEKLWPDVTKLALELLGLDDFARRGTVQFNGEQIREILT